MSNNEGKFLTIRSLLNERWIRTGVECEYLPIPQSNEHLVLKYVLECYYLVSLQGRELGEETEDPAATRVVKSAVTYKTKRSLFGNGEEAVVLRRANHQTFPK